MENIFLGKRECTFVIYSAAGIGEVDLDSFCLITPRLCPVETRGRHINKLRVRHFCYGGKGCMHACVSHHHLSMQVPPPCTLRWACATTSYP